MRLLRRSVRRLLTRWGLVNPTFEEIGAIFMRIQWTGRVTHEDVTGLALRGVDVRRILAEAGVR